MFLEGLYQSRACWEGERRTSDECVLGEFFVETFWRGAVEVEVYGLGGGDECAEGGQARKEGAHLLAGVERCEGVDGQVFENML